MRRSMQPGVRKKIKQMIEDIQSGRDPQPDEPSAPETEPAGWPQMAEERLAD
jgi:hypothetical protein